MSDKIPGLTEAIETAIRDGRGDLKQDAEWLQRRVAEGAAKLVVFAGRPGYDMAVLAERDNILIEAGLVLWRSAQSQDARIVGIIEAALWAAATA